MTHDPAGYGRRMAADYDAIYAGRHDTDGAVELLAELAGAGPVLELGIGTGRLALPLRRRGLAVHGVDASDAMVAELRGKPDGADVPVTIADFTDLRLPELQSACTLVALVFNTIFAVPDQAAQVGCYRSAARHLRPGGHFVVEAWVPDSGWSAGHLPVRSLVVDADRVIVETAEHDPVRQTLRTTKVSLADGDLRLYPANHRYAWPAELDLMAELAGLRPVARWADWRRSPFTADSRQHVSVYRRG